MSTTDSWANHEEEYQKCVAKYKTPFKKWNDFNIWECTDDELLYLAFYMFEDRHLLHHFKVDKEVFYQFLLAVRSGYKTIPYHSWKHAFDVAHACYLYLTEFGFGGFFLESDIFVLLISALCHDIDHPGLTNSYHIHAQTPLAHKSQNVAVLEHHHYDCSLTLLSKTNVLEGMGIVGESNAKELMRKFILATDMESHKEKIAELEERHIAKHHFSKETEADRKILGEMVLHSADLSNVCRPWEVSNRWSYRCAEEFTNQAVLEQASGLPVIMNLDKESMNVPVMALEFGENVVKPLLVPLSRISKMEAALENLKLNSELWRGLLAPKTK